MPIFEYVCSDCQHRFEHLTRGSARPHCPACEGEHLEKQLSVFAVGGPATGGFADAGPGACGSCGDPRGPGACSLN